MKYRMIAALIAVSAVTLSAFAGDKHDMQISIATIDDATQEEVRVDLDSKSLGFDLHDMQEGENRSVVDKNGQNVLITREAEGLKFDVDGKPIDGATQQAIKSLIESAGHDSEVHFVERMMAPHDGGDRFRIIEKRVEVKN